LVRVLISEEDSPLRDCLIHVAGEALGNVAELDFIAPAGNREEDLWDTVAQQPFDLAVLILNNLQYATGNETGELVAQSISLVGRLVDTSCKPVIACYGWPDLPDYPLRLQAAGAHAVFRLPLAVEALREAIRECLRSAGAENGSF
jgi:DNA-binding NarL/FixJ family response regulator